MIFLAGFLSAEVSFLREPPGIEDLVVLLGHWASLDCVFRLRGVLASAVFSGVLPTFLFFIVTLRPLLFASALRPGVGIGFWGLSALAFGVLWGLGWVRSSGFGDSFLKLVATVGECDCVVAGSLWLSRFDLCVGWVVSGPVLGG